MLSRLKGSIPRFCFLPQRFEAFSCSSVNGGEKPKLKVDLISTFNSLLYQSDVSVINLNTLLGKIKKEGDHRSVVVLAKEMELRGVKHDLVTLNILIDSLSHLNSNMNFSFSIFAKVLKLGFFPSIVTLHSLIKGLCEKGMVDEAYEFHNKFIESGFLFDNATYRTLINSFYKANKLSFAFDLITTLPSHLPQDVALWNSIINTLCQVKEVDEAFKLYHEMVKKNICPDLFTFNALILGTCRIKCYGKSFELFRGMFSKDIQPDEYSFNTLVSALGDDGHLRECLCLCSMMIKSGLVLDTITYNGLLLGYFGVNNWQEAVSLFKSMREREVNPSVQTYNIMLKHLLRLNLGSEALEVYANMGRDKLVHPNVITFNLLINYMINANRLNEACYYLEQMHAVGISSELSTYNILLVGLFKRFQYSKAVKLLGFIQKRGFKFDAYTQTIVVHGLCMNKRLAEARSFLNDLKKNGCLEVAACNVMIKWLSGRRLFNEALSFFRKMESNMGCKPDMTTYAVIIFAFLKKGEQRFAEDVIHDLVGNYWNFDKDADEETDIFRFFCHSLIGEGVEAILAGRNFVVFTQGIKKTIIALGTELELMSKEVGAQTEQNFAEDALNATKLMLLRLNSKVDEIRDTLADDEEKVGAKIVKRAFNYPMKKVLSNADLTCAYDASNNKDLMSAGIIDPTKVEKYCIKLEQASSIARTFLMSEAVLAVLNVINKPEAAPVVNLMYNSAKFIKWNNDNYSGVIVNVDGSCLGNPIKAGFGGVVRNSSGVYLSGFSGFMRGSSDTLHVELQAIYEGLILAQDLNLVDVVLYSDSLTCINLIQGPSKSHVHAALIENIRDLIDNNKFTICHTLREANSCADFMAKLGASSERDISYHETPPEGLTSLLTLDAAGTLYRREGKDYMAKLVKISSKE